MISGSEVAFFSISDIELDELDKDGSTDTSTIVNLKAKPRKLLATILIANNFINIAIVIISDYILRALLPESIMTGWAEGLHVILPFLSVAVLSRTVSILITIVLVSFLLVLFGEVAPKIYANINNLQFARSMATPLKGLNWLFTPISNVLVNWSNKLEKRLGNVNNVTSKEELDKAIELTVSQEFESEEEVDILRGILKFGNVTTRQIMKNRVDVVGLDIETDYKEVLQIIKEHGYSRIPVYVEDFDNIAGVLYVKDLLGHTNEDKDFRWQTHIRTEILYVPETKKIDDLLKEFQQKRMHIAIVVDEFGGSAGIVTLEDIMEEVIGDIKDEFDEEEEVEYVKINDNNYIFEGKSLLNDVARIIGEDTEVFEEVKGNADSLAGLVLEIVGQIPKKDKEFFFKHFRFRVVQVSKKRIEKIHVSILEAA
jgi:gliding motility-associated protein GldE